MANKIFGIDLGTTYSCIAHLDEYGHPSVILNLDNQPTTPSVVLFDGVANAVVGRQAKGQTLIRSQDVVELVKRHMYDPDWRVPANGTEYSAPQVASHILRSLAAAAERATGIAPNEVVITVPAYFGDNERKATKEAAQLAGLTVNDLLDEPVAAAFAYGFAHDGIDRQTVLVFDLGGGTFDTTVITLEGRTITRNCHPWRP